MNKIEHILPMFELTKKDTRNRRSFILSEFENEINNERASHNWRYQVGKVWKNYAPITGKELAIRLSHLKEDDLFYFLSVCRDYKKRNGSFSKCFYGALKLAKKK